MGFEQLESTPGAASSNRQLRILLVDDEPMMQRSLRRLLSLRHWVVTACDGTEAVALLRDDRDFDVVLCDLMMPGIDGPGVYAYLDEHIPELLDRTVFMTGGAFTERAKSFVRECEPRLLEKPIAVTDLLAAIEALAKK